MKSARSIAQSAGLIPAGFRWRTMEGEVLALDEMETSHVFNAMKMIFNHLAEAWGGRPVWFTKAYGDYQDRAETDPAKLAGLVVFFIQEIERRGNLPDKYVEPYRSIVDQILPKLEPAVRLMLPSPSPKRRIS